jgi:small GTP-binding protein
MVKETSISLLGHKDHGKSTLIGRILHETGSISPGRVEETRAICRNLGKEFELAFLLDSFAEERSEGFTLDTTVAQAKHNGVIYNLIDVPGHKELVKNMLSGMSKASAAVLIVSAKKNEGLQNETRLHIYLARMLGIKRLAVAVNKMDSVGFSEAEFRGIKEGVSRILQHFGFSPAELDFVPISAKDGDNVISRSKNTDWYRGKILMELLEEFASMDENAALRKLPGRMFVQDVYGEVIVGKVETGTFCGGQEVVVEPAGLRTRIKEINGADGKERKEARAGQNIGLRLFDQKGITRGCLLMQAENAAVPKTSVRARIFCFPGNELKSGEPISIACSSQESEARITGIMNRFDPIKDADIADGGRIGPSESAEVELTISNKMVLERFADIQNTARFVISKKGRIAGVGIVQ